LDAARRALKRGEQTLIISGDLASFYDTVDPSFMLGERLVAGLQDRGATQVDLDEYVRATASLSGSPGRPTQDLPEYRAAAAMLAKARLDLDHAEVRAPVDGIVGLHDLQVGEYINVGQTAMPLVATNPIWVEANFKETELTRMHVGQQATVEVDTYPGVKWKAHVASIAPASGAEFSVLPPQNATGNWVKIVQRIPVRLEIDGADRRDAPQLRAGMSADVEVDLRDPDGGGHAGKATAAR
jgi:membrane fusion protein (multidrug efflux system)